ncbi:hypothetical protein IGJ02_000488 [Enterococcus sp. DIV0724b]|uniref:LPXTG cell wall anchor domain-containing protein n=1 Tax=Enterococcus sp. DIV0724b TaxID=2774694 RepID=UPI003D2FFF17
MKKRKNLKIIIASILLLTFSLVNVQVSLAQEGAEVKTEGDITLYDTASSDSEQSTTSSSLDKMIKPKGKFPSTGEVVKYGLPIIGIAFLFLLFIIYLVKRRYQNNEKEQ